MLLITDI